MDTIKSAGHKPAAEAGKRAPKRRHFIPSRWLGRYWLPARVHDMLTQRLGLRFKNRDAAHRLAKYLGWKHSGSERFGKPFPILRQVLKDQPDLGLSEDQIRGAIKTLLRVEFIVRDPTSGSEFKRTSANGVRRKMHRYHYGPEFASAFAHMLRKSPTLRETQKKQKNPCLPRRVGEIAPPAPIRCKPTAESRAPGFDEHLAALAASIDSDGPSHDAFAGGPESDAGKRAANGPKTLSAIDEAPFVEYLNGVKATQMQVGRRLRSK
jgi:hypothetical protein